MQILKMLQSVVLSFEHNKQATFAGSLIEPVALLARLSLEKKRRKKEEEKIARDVTVYYVNDVIYTIEM